MDGELNFIFPSVFYASAALWYGADRSVAGFSAKDVTPCASTSARGHFQVNDQRTSNTSNSSTPTID